MNTQLRLLLVLTILASLAVAPGAARAEGGEGNPFDGENVIRNDGPSDGGANDPLVKQSVGDVNSIQDNSKKNDQRGRREKIEDDAIPKGQAGVGAALAAGISLTAAGTPMLMSPFLPTQLRGAALLAKAGLEFAQAAATAGVNQQNKKAGDAVSKNSDGPTGNQLEGQTPEDVKKAAAEAVNSPELQKALGEAGINSDNFVNQLVNGQLATPEAVMGAAGVDTSKFSAEQFAASSANGHEELPHVTYNDSASTAAGAGGSGSGSDRGLTSQGAPNQNAEAGQSPAEVYAQAQAMAARALATARQTGADKLLGLNEKDLVEKYLAHLMKTNSGKTALAASDMALYDLGIKRLRPKQTIFQVARKSYHDFGRWRGKRPARLAQAASPLSTVKR